MQYFNACLSNLPEPESFDEGEYLPIPRIVQFGLLYIPLLESQSGKSIYTVLVSTTCYLVTKIFLTTLHDRSISVRLANLLGREREWQRAGAYLSNRHGEDNVQCYDRGVCTEKEHFTVIDIGE